MSTSLSGAVALVTGASSGIGAATAVHLARHGAAVGLVARRADRLREVAALVRDAGGTPLVVEADVTDAAQASGAVQQVADQLGGLDVLVNNAGVMLLGPVEDAPVQEWDRMVALNLQGLLYTTHAALPHLLKAAQGPRATADVVNVSSVAGRTSHRGMAVYALTKHGVGAFSESLRQEVSERHVRVSLVEPGPVSTELFSHIRPEVLAQAQNPFGDRAQILLPEDVAETIGFVVTRPARVAVNEVLVRPDGSA